MSQVTTHILDTARGRPAGGITVMMSQLQGENWRQISLKTSDDNGRVSDLLPGDTVVEPGQYRIRFETKSYFDQAGTACFYPYVEVTFNIAGPEHYHIPLLISPYGYTTYRGS
jgi:5-hydroxyisourate hydrolase